MGNSIAFEIKALVLASDADAGLRGRCPSSGKNDSRPLRTSLTARKAAEAVLRERGPLTLVEIAVEIQALGCRTLETPRQIVRAIREAFQYHADEFWQDADKRWSVVILT